MTPDARRAYVRGLFDGDLASMIDWAVQSLLRGAESEALVVLAGLGPRDDGDEVRRYFARALEDLNEKPDALDEEVIRYAADLSRQVLAGGYDVRLAAREIAQLAIGLNYREELMHWYGVDDEFDLADAGTYSTRAQAEQSAQDAARDLVAKVNPEKQD